LTGLPEAQRAAHARAQRAVESAKGP
jgi:hypothetical protein